MNTQFVKFENKMLPTSVARGLLNGDLAPLRPWQELPTWKDRVRSFFSLTSAKSSFVEGADISKWQVSWDIQKSIDAGLQYAFIKASQNRFTDSKFDEFANQAAVANFPFGCYHFADPSGYSAIQQAQYFASVVKGVGDLSVVLDMEWTGGLSPSALSRWGEDFIGELGVHLGDRLIEIYTRMSWWNTYVAFSPWVKENNVGLWAARWASWLEGPWSDGKYVPRTAEWTTWMNWQYSADGNGLGSTYGVESTSIDLNYFNGDWDAFVAHYMPTPPIPPIDPDLAKRVAALEVKTDATNVRVDENEESIKLLAEAVSDNEIDTLNLTTRVEKIEEECCGNGDTPALQTLKVRGKKKEDNTYENVVVYEFLYYDESCVEYKEIHPDYDGPDGKPVAEPPSMDVRVVYKNGAQFEIVAAVAVSCKDNPYNYIIHGSGYDFAEVADGYPGAGSLVRLDKIDVL